MEDVINAFQAVVRNKDVEVIKQKAEGDNMYIIGSGSVDVFVARGSSAGRGEHVLTLGPGGLFGELALLYSSPRAATCVVTSASANLWALASHDFKMLLMKGAQEEYNQYTAWLRNVDILKGLNQHEMAQLAEAIEPVEYAEGQEIIVQGSRDSDCFFMLQKGMCAAYIGGTAGEKEVKRYTRQGDYFGEVALLRGTARQASIRAIGGPAIVCHISRHVFDTILGPLKPRLTQEIDKYPQYAQFLR